MLLATKTATRLPAARGLSGWAGPLAVAAALLASLACMNAAQTNLPALQLLELDRPLVIAHRGFSAIAPENTLPAFRLAIAAGADLIELDYFHSRDNVPVVFHDSTLDRTTDAKSVWGGAKIRVDSKSAVELAALDAGRWFDPQFAGVRIPTLAEALQVIQSGGVTLIERKGGGAPECVRLLRERNLINRVVVQAFDWAYLSQFHELEPSQVLGALGPRSERDGKKLTEQEQALGSAWLDEIQQCGARIVGWNKNVTRDSVRLAKERGFKVWIYTINDPNLAATLLDYGVDGIITDNPALIWKTIALQRTP